MREKLGLLFMREKVEKLWSDEEDKSRAGHADAEIVPLLRVVNGKRHLYTASSCAGRLIVTLNRTDERTGGYAVPWLFVSHALVQGAAAMMGQVEQALAQVEPREELRGTECWFKLEPPIVAIVCSSADVATKVMNLSRAAAGIKRCSVISIRPDGGHILSLSDTKRIETLTHIDGRCLLDMAYLETVVSVANRKLTESRSRMDKFARALSESQVFENDEQ